MERGESFSVATYASHDGYVNAVTKAAVTLERQRFFLHADVQRYIEAARASRVLR